MPPSLLLAMTRVQRLFFLFSPSTHIQNDTKLL